jgi:adenosine deaminase
MSVASYIQAMPKVELSLSLEGAMQRNSLLRIAEANEIPETLKHYSEWVSLLDKPDYKRLGDITRMATSWLQIADDLSRVVYDVGVSLSKSNVRYAEIAVNPFFYDGIGLSIDDFLAAINDGRGRARRAWGVEIYWLLTVPREEPRRADDYARTATAPTAVKNGIVGLGLSGREDSQPVGQFERAFHTAEKKGVPRVVRAGGFLGAGGVLAAIETLFPNRVIDARGVHESPEAMALLEERQISVGIGLTRALRQGWVDNLSEYPLRQLYDEGIVLFLGTDMPSLYHTSLVDEYTKAIEECGLSLDELDELALNAVRVSFMPEEDKAAMMEQFREDYARLRAEHITSGEPA